LRVLGHGTRNDFNGGPVPKKKHTHTIKNRGPYIERGFEFLDHQPIMNPNKTSSSHTGRPTHIKIFGERNSGTRYLEQLLRLNLRKVRFCSWLYSRKSGWKHGFPRMSKCVHIKDNTLFVFVVRDLRPWLKSMYHNRYHFSFKGGFGEFVNGYMVNEDKRPDHDVLVYPEERGNVVDIRKRKFLASYRFMGQVRFAIMLNLEDAQSRPEDVIDFICSTFRIPRAPAFRPYNTHTKLKTQCLQNREYTDLSFQGLYVHQIDYELEARIENLKQCKFEYVNLGKSYKVK